MGSTNVLGRVYQLEGQETFDAQKIQEAVKEMTSLDESISQDLQNILNEIKKDRAQKDVNDMESFLRAEWQEAFLADAAAGKASYSMIKPDALELGYEKVLVERFTQRRI